MKRIARGWGESDGRRMPGLGHLPIGKLTVYTINDWFSRLTTFWYDDPNGRLVTRQRMFAALRKALNDAKLGNRNPMIGADPPNAKADSETRRGPAVFSDDELRALLRAADRHENRVFSSLVWLLATTGVRIGEALALTWGNVNLDRTQQSIVIDASLSEANGKPQRGPTKTGEAREIGIPTALADRLRRLRLMRGARARNDDVVFGTGLGTAMRQSNVMRRLWHPLLDSEAIGRTAFHRLRHTYASILLAEDRPVTEVSARLGHKDVRTTLTIYAHAMPGSDAEATAAIERWVSESS